MCAGAHPRPRGGRRRRRGRPWRHRLPPWRPRADLLHLGLRQVRVLPAGDVLPLHDRRLDPRQRDRRNPGRVRPHPARRHQSLSDPDRRRRGSVGDAERHPADRLRVRGPERQGRARLDGGDRGVWANRPGRAADRAVLFACRDHHDRCRRQSPRGRPRLRRDPDGQQRRRQGGRDGQGADRRSRASIRPSKRSACPRPSSYARTWSRPAA